MQAKVTKQIMNHIIKHEGVIEQLEGNHVRVRIFQMEACGSCIAAKHCNASGAKTKIIDVYASATAHFNIGQEVTVSTSGTVVKQAVLLSFIMPLFLLIGSLMLAKGSRLSDESAALIAIGLLVFYYLVLWALKGNISKSISFRIEPE